MAEIVTEPTTLKPSAFIKGLTVNGKKFPTEDTLLLREIRDTLKEMLELIKRPPTIQYELSPNIEFDGDFSTDQWQKRVDAAFARANASS